MSHFAFSSQVARSEEHTSELQSPCNLVCRLLLEKKNSNETFRALRLARANHCACAHQQLYPENAAPIRSAMKLFALFVLLALTTALAPTNSFAQNTVSYSPTAYGTYA